jgi:hypothetical protein
MTADSLLLQLKYDSVIEEFARQSAKPLREAMDLFYKSITYDEMCNGISDMHCRSDEYLAEELRLELEQSTVQ